MCCKLWGDKENMKIRWQGVFGRKRNEQRIHRACRGEVEGREWCFSLHYRIVHTLCLFCICALILKVAHSKNTNNSSNSCLDLVQRYQQIFHESDCHASQMKVAWVCEIESFCKLLVLTHTRKVAKSILFNMQMLVW